MNRNPKLALLLVLALYVVLAYIYLLVKPCWCDEHWAVIPSRNLDWFGFLGMGDTPSLSPDPVTNSRLYMYWHPPLSFWSMAGWFALWERYDVVMGRWHTILWGIALLGAVFYIGSCRGQAIWKCPIANYFNTAHKWTGVWAALICAIDYNFLMTSDARPDVMCAALGLWAIALGSEWLAAASCLVHPFGVMYAIVVAIQNRRIKLFPYLIAACMWGIYIVQAPDLWFHAFIMNWVMHFEQVLNVGVVSNNEPAKGSAVFMAYAFGWRLVVLAVYLVCVWLTARKSDKYAWMFLLLVIPAFFIVHSVNYMPHAIPVLALCVAIQMRRFKWWGLIAIPMIVFAITSLFPLWGWDGIFTLR